MRDEDSAPSDGQTKAERNGQYEAGFVIVPCEIRALPRAVDIGDGKKPIPRAAMTGVYVELAAYVGESIAVWPSIATLSEASGFSPDYVGRVLKALEYCGAIMKRRRDNHGMKQSNEYVLRYQKPPKPKIPPTAATLPPTAALDTASSGNGYRPQRHELEQSEQQPTEQHAPLPPKLANGHAARRAEDEYIDLLGPERIETVTGWFQEIDRDFSIGWLRNRLREFRHDVPDLTADQLKAGLSDGFNQFQRRYDKDPSSIGSFRALARTILLDALREQQA